ncbi:hypothetical protein [Motilimonas cestriensis]|uniref:hypothetical protein n=1 Tax=Motilimonas cestriensis TaxID=2742685 RepID=UPI003DA26869
MKKLKWVKQTSEIELLDIPSLSGLSNDDFKEYVNEHLLFIDHHEILRDKATSHPIATNKEQVDILINELLKIKGAMR